MYISTIKGSAEGVGSREFGCFSVKAWAQTGFHEILQAGSISGSYLLPFFHLLGHVYALQITLISLREYNEANPREPSIIS